MLLSLLGHALLFLLVLVGANLMGPTVIELGGEEGGGRNGGWVTVGLTDELSGGAGMYKPSLTRQPQSSPPRPAKARPSPPVKPAEAVFEESRGKKTKKSQGPAQKVLSTASKQDRPTPGLIPQEPKPGSGGRGGAPAGAGGGIGSGSGVLVGAGVGGRGIDSWYVRQVEQRIGQNWLRASLGRLPSPVETVVAFEVALDGRIADVQITRSSGNRTVDRAAERAVRASDPLPPLPFELRRGRFKFVAHFQYPPR